MVPFEELRCHYDPRDVDAFVAISSTQLNRVRTRLFHSVKEAGFICATYVSSRAFVWHNVSIGENTFVFENNVLQHHVRIGDNVVIWSGNHIGHRVVVHDHCFISSHVVISGFCEIGESSFMGVNKWFLLDERAVVFRLPAKFCQPTAISRLVVVHPTRPRPSHASGTARTPGPPSRRSA